MKSFIIVRKINGISIEELIGKGGSEYIISVFVGYGFHTQVLSHWLGIQSSDVFPHTIIKGSGQYGYEC